MPWTSEEASEHTKAAKTPEQKKKWAKVANAALKTYKGDEGKAIATANAAMGDSFWDGDTFSLDGFIKSLRDAEAAPAILRDASIPSSNDIVLYDAIDFKDAKVTFKQDGSLVAMPRTARTGIQMYLGSECGQPDKPVVRVYRPPEEVFDKRALKSYTHRTVTLDHPTVDVDASNWKQLAVGYTGDEILRDGETFRVPMMLADAAAVAAYKDGVNQLSWGYKCDLDWTPGTTKDGEPFDAVQRNLRANHLAVVANARGGSSLTIGDANHDQSKLENKDMNQPVTTLTLDGLSIAVDPQTANIISRHIEGLKKTIADAAKKSADDDDEKKKAKEAADNKDKAIATANDALKAKDAEIVTLKKTITDEQAKTTAAALDALVVDRLNTIRKASLIMGNTFKTDGRSEVDIRKEVVQTKVGDAAKSWDDNMIKASFDTLPLPGQNGQPGNNRGSSMVNDAVQAFTPSYAGRPGNGYQVHDAKQSAYDQYERDLVSNYRGGDGGNNRGGNNNGGQDFRQ